MTFNDNACRILFSPVRTRRAFRLFKDNPCCESIFSSSFKMLQNLEQSAKNSAQTSRVVGYSFKRLCKTSFVTLNTSAESVPSNLGLGGFCLFLAVSQSPKGRSSSRINTTSGWGISKSVSTTNVLHQICQRDVPRALECTHSSPASSSHQSIRSLQVS